MMGNGSFVSLRGKKTSYEVKELDENDEYSLGCLKLALCGLENKLYFSQVYLWKDQ